MPPKSVQFLANRRTGMPNESIALAMPCTFELVGRDPETGALETTWDGDLQAVVVRSDQEELGFPTLVALVSKSATPQPFFPDYGNQIVSTPVGDFAYDEFRMLFFRCDANGAYVGNFLDPAWMQIRDAKDAGAEAHVDDINAMIDACRSGQTFIDEISWRSFDIATTGETDGLSTEEVKARASARENVPLNVAHGLDGLTSLKMAPLAMSIDEDEEMYPVADLVLEGWTEIRQFPSYFIDGVRVLFKRFLADRIGDTAIEDIVRIHYAPGMLDAIADVFQQEGFEDRGISPPFEDRQIMRGGYVTSEVRNFRGNGVDIIAFEDFAGAYAYAWPEQPTLTAHVSRL